MSWGEPRWHPGGEGVAGRATTQQAPAGWPHSRRWSGGDRTWRAFWDKLLIQSKRNLESLVMDWNAAESNGWLWVRCKVRGVREDRKEIKRMSTNLAGAGLAKTAYKDRRPRECGTTMITGLANSASIYLALPITLIFPRCLDSSL